MFITIEGGEGAGKSTLQAGLKKRLEVAGERVVTTREPGGCPLAEELREIVLKSKEPICSRAELLMFLAARAQHLEEVILPALSAGKIVLCDRFHDSTIAYQGYGRKENIEEITSLCMAVSGSHQPNLTFFLDIDPAIGVARDQDTQDRMETEALGFHHRIRHGFQTLAQQHPDRIVTLDATQSSEQVLEQAHQKLKKHAVLSHHR